MALVLVGAFADFAESVEEYGAAERILLLTLVEADVATTTQLGVLQPCCFDEIGTSAQEKDYRDRAKVSPSLQVIPLRCDLKDRTAVVGRAKEMTLRIGQEPVSGSEDYPIAGATPRGHAVESAHGVDDHAACGPVPSGPRRRSSLLPKIKLCRLDRIRHRLLRCLILCGFVAFAPSLALGV